VTAHCEKEVQSAKRENRKPGWGVVAGRIIGILVLGAGIPFAAGLCTASPRVTTTFRVSWRSALDRCSVPLSAIEFRACYHSRDLCGGLQSVGLCDRRLSDRSPARWAGIFLFGIAVRLPLSLGKTDCC
jgi:hypothetical protein